jgi:hypothetical protein
VSIGVTRPVLARMVETAVFRAVAPLYALLYEEPTPAELATVAKLLVLLELMEVLPAIVGVLTVLAVGATLLAKAVCENAALIEKAKIESFAEVFIFCKSRNYWWPTSDGLLLVTVGYCWLLLVTVGYCWLLFDKRRTNFI